MRTRRLPALLAWVLALAPLGLSGCLLAAGGAAAGSGIYLTTRGAEAVVHGTVDELTTASRQAFETLGVDYEGQEDQDDDGREVFGATDDGDVTVELDRRTDNATRVHVEVQTGTVTWDQDMARRLLGEIQDLRGG